MVLEKVTVAPTHVLASWQANDDATFILRRRQEEDNVQDRFNENDTGVAHVHLGGTASLVWKIGAAYCKVKAWVENLELESDTINFVKENCNIPVPNIIHCWVDPLWNRTFLIMEPVAGQTLRQAWPSLSADDRLGVARSVVKYCEILASFTSKKLQSVCGAGALEPFLTAAPLHSEPSWKPAPLGPLSGAELQDYSLPQYGQTFYLLHADLGPDNIMISDDGKVSALLDWESAAFYPYFWVGTKPLVSPGFLLDGDSLEAKRAWRVLLAEELDASGFNPDMKRYAEWRKAIGKA